MTLSSFLSGPTWTRSNSNNSSSEERADSLTVAYCLRAYSCLATNVLVLTRAQRRAGRARAAGGAACS